MALFNLAFRPFFLFGALFGMVAIALWTAFWHGASGFHPYGGPLWWHQHEMLFGFAAAIVTGFLLTAVQNWTGQRSVHGLPLAGLVLLWGLARLLLAMETGLPVLVIAVIDIALLPLVAIALARRVLAARQWRNMGFAPILLLLATANALMHAGATMNHPDWVAVGSQMTLLLISTLIVVVGGRVIPLFSASRLGTQPPRRYPALEWTAIGGMLALVLLQAAALLPLNLPAALVSAVAAVTGLANLIRLTSWKGWRTGHEPMLWSMHLAYGFVGLGLLLWALHDAGAAVPRSAALHALGIGAIGGMILTFISRVSLGHTGRTITASRGLVSAFVLINAAALVRIFMALGWQPGSAALLGLSATAWLIAYGLFLWKLAPALVLPRPDGRTDS